MHLGRTTLSKFLIQQLNGIEGANDLGALLVDVAAAVKAISAMTAKGALGGFLGEHQQQERAGRDPAKARCYGERSHDKQLRMGWISRRHGIRGIG
jgi:fructose-1,6-bisphosphatase I/sedoheptulose-1,7-bisphosphatase